jgi:hypothetical protein
MQGASLKGLVESLGAEGFYQKVCTLLNEQTLTVDDFSYYELAEACGVLPQLSRLRGWQPGEIPSIDLLRKIRHNVGVEARPDPVNQRRTDRLRSDR